jgi:hypothetical protein
MQNDNLKFETMDNATDERFKSFVMIAHQNNIEVASIAHYEGEWSVGLYARNEYIRIPWKNFLEIFHRFNLFLVQEDQAMLEDCER